MKNYNGRLEIKQQKTTQTS